MTPALGWALVVAALLAGYVGYGAAGLLLAATVIVFWLLLQFSRTLRVMRRAGRAPVGTVDSAVMLNAKLRAGMTMLELLPLAGSLGQVVGTPDAETYRWRDAGGAALRAEFRGGRLQRWALERADGPASGDAGGAR